MTMGLQTTVVTLCVILGCHDANGLVCRYCFGNTWESCGDGEYICQQGFENCFAGYLYTGDSGQNIIYTRGCTSCPNARIGCEIINATLPYQIDEPVRGCEIECCDEDMCNDMRPTPTTAAPVRNSQEQISFIWDSFLTVAFLFASTAFP